MEPTYIIISIIKNYPIQSLANSTITIYNYNIIFDIIATMIYQYTCIQFKAYALLKLGIQEFRNCKFQLIFYKIFIISKNDL